MTTPPDTAPIPMAQPDIDTRIQQAIEAQLRYRGTIAPRWHTVAIGGLAVSLLSWTGVMAVRLLMQPPSESAVYALIDEAIAPNLPTATVDTTVIQEQIQQLQDQVSYLRSHQANSPSTLPTAATVTAAPTATIPRDLQPPLTDQDWTILPAERFRFAANAFEGNYALDMPQSHIQPVVANLGAGQNLAINNIPDEVSLIVYSTDGAVLAAQDDGTWAIPSTGDVTIDVMATTDVQGAIRIAAR